MRRVDDERIVDVLVRRPAIPVHDPVRRHRQLVPLGVVEPRLGKVLRHAGCRREAERPLAIERVARGVRVRVPCARGLRAAARRRVLVLGGVVLECDHRRGPLSMKGDGEEARLSLSLQLWTCCSYLTSCWTDGMKLRRGAEWAELSEMGRSATYRRRVCKHPARVQKFPFAKTRDMQLVLGGVV